MSTVMFPTLSSSNLSTNGNNKSRESRIPVPSSPGPLRRSGSLRLAPDFSSDRRIKQQRAGWKPEQAENDPRLKRGNSFMERGERRGKHGATRPQILNTAAGDQLPKSPRTPKGVNTPQSPARIRSLSLSLSSTKLSPHQHPHSPSAVTSSPRTPPTSPLDNRQTYSNSNNVDWDTESLTSITSINSVGSCDHASVARNGTTFSGRSMKYVFHCSQHAGATGEDYLTPTQRVHRQVKKLKYFLQQARQDLEQKDSDILKLTKEVVELRLYKAALNSPEDSKSNSSDAVTVRENSDEQITPSDLLDGLSSLQNDEITDSGHFEDFANEKARKPSPIIRKTMVEKAVTAQLSSSPEHNQLIIEYERRLQELVKTHEEESYQLKQKHNDKVEELLQRITEINKRYWELVPEMDLAKEKIKELEAQLEEACRKLDQTEDHNKQKEDYLEMYSQESEESRVSDLVAQGPSRISVPELLQELQVTKNELENIKAMYRQLIEVKNKNKIDPEITLQFLKSAVYYFLTDKENSQGHLRAIQSILGFTPSEISNIDKARLA